MKKTANKMYIYNTTLIQEVISRLKEVKILSFLSSNSSIDFAKIMITCRTVDTFMLPLYYIWENHCHRKLKDLGFEEHLKKPYQRFAKAPKTYTREMYFYINLYSPFAKQLGRTNVMKIAHIYKTFLENNIVIETTKIGPQTSHPNIYETDCYK